MLWKLTAFKMKKSSNKKFLILFRNPNKGFRVHSQLGYQKGKKDSMTCMGLFFAITFT
jgi:hypothetical protein